MWTALVVSTVGTDICPNILDKIIMMVREKLKEYKLRFYFQEEHANKM